MKTDIKQLFKNEIPEQLCQLDDLSAADRGIFEIQISGKGGGTWTIDTTKSPPQVKSGANSRADVSVEMNAEDFLDFYQGKLGGFSALLGGKIRIKGNMALATRLGQIIQAKF